MSAGAHKHFYIRCYLHRTTAPDRSPHSTTCSGPSSTLTDLPYDDPCTLERTTSEHGGPCGPEADRHGAHIVAGQNDARSPDEQLFSMGRAERSERPASASTDVLQSIHSPCGGMLSSRAELHIEMAHSVHYCERTVVGIISIFSQWQTPRTGRRCGHQLRQSARLRSTPFRSFEFSRSAT
jgi:hypothetical protein